MTQRHFIGDGHDAVGDMQRAFRYAVDLARQNGCGLLVHIAIVGNLTKADFDQILPPDVFTSFKQRKSILWEGVNVQLFDGKTKGNLYSQGVVCLRCGEPTMENIERENAPRFIVTAPNAPGELENWAKKAGRIA